ncbi:MAG: hypothetical protein ACOYH4_04605 [Saccharofermentanales bacterium]|jgi:ABC-type glycerol-3-phosphate transport system permease component
MTDTEQTHTSATDPKEKRRQTIRLTIGYGIMFLVVVVIVAVLMTYPFYPAFVKEVKSYDRLVRELQPTRMIVPDLEAAEIEGETFRVLLDRRDLQAKPIGYFVEGHAVASDAAEPIDVTLRVGPSEEAPDVSGTPEAYAYRGVPIRIFYTVETADPERVVSVVMSVIGDQRYEITATRGSADDIVMRLIDVMHDVIDQSLDVS